MPKAMIRSVAPLAIAITLWTGAAHAQLSQADLLTRIDRLEAELRELTGTVEQLQYRNQQLEQQVQRLGQGASSTAPARPGTSYPPPPAATEYSPPPLAPPAPAMVAAAPAAPSEPVPAPGRRGDAFDPSLNPNAPGVPRVLGAPGVAAAEPPPVADASAAVPRSRQPGAPLNLSTLSATPSEAAPDGELPPPPPPNPSATGAMQASLPPSNTPKDEYDLAYGYVLHKDYGLAEDTFRDFLHKYPSDRRVPEAQYWLGESLFMDQHYRDAAEAFLAVSTKYESTARAPDALLRLGQSLAALGEKEAACASLGEVLRKYPRASLGVKQGVEREQKRVHC
jgi:tol-pal system protein YbgF